MKLSDYIPQLKALAAKYGYDNATVSLGYTVWDFAHVAGLEGEYIISLHLDTCHQTKGETIEVTIANMELRLANRLDPVTRASLTIQEPELA